MKRIGLICVAMLFMFSNVASATNWVLAVRWEVKAKDMSYSIYIDADSVVRDGDTFVFWMLSVNDTPAFGTKKTMEKDEVRLTRPPMTRTVENYFYDDSGALIAINSSSDMYDTDFSPYPPDSNFATCATLAVKYAKEGKLGKGIGPRPVP